MPGKMFNFPDPAIYNAFESNYSNKTGFVNNQAFPELGPVAFPACSIPL